MQILIDFYWLIDEELVFLNWYTFFVQTKCWLIAPKKYKHHYSLSGIVPRKFSTSLTNLFGPAKSIVFANGSASIVSDGTLARAPVWMGLKRGLPIYFLKPLFI